MNLASLAGTGGIVGLVSMLERLVVGCSISMLSGAGLMEIVAMCWTCGSDRHGLTGDGYGDPSDHSVLGEEIPSTKLLRRLCQQAVT
jgi:hypothetical protein